MTTARTATAPAPVTITFGQPLPKGPTAEHIGSKVARVTIDSLVVGLVVEVKAFGGWVRLSDGVCRQRSLGDWFLLEGEARS